MNSSARGDIVGSYRRELPTSGDVDILIVKPEDEDDFLNKLTQKLVDQGIIQHIFALGEKTVHATYFSDYPTNRGILRKIDINLIPEDVYGPALLHYTGPDSFNASIRASVLEKDDSISLSQYGLRKRDPKTGKPTEEIAVPASSEEDVFEWLDMDYVEPKDRV
jgi:DNA polymerase/3'-5' exonuclease PolX